MAREVYELRLNYNNSVKRVNDLKDCLNIDSLLCEINKLEEECNQEGFWDDNVKAKQVLKKLNTILLLKNLKIENLHVLEL